MADPDRPTGFAALVAKTQDEKAIGNTRFGGSPTGNTPSNLSRRDSKKEQKRTKAAATAAAAARNDDDDSDPVLVIPRCMILPDSVFRLSWDMGEIRSSRGGG